ncbi:MAG: hypothetical protein NTX45_21980 [Proteobacteria bacterium]|nr:hypothetical protein [Pseudomonadota bacterium]
MNNPVVLTYKFVKQSDNLGVLSYSLSNTSSQDVYLFTPLSEFRDGHIQAFPSRIYVYWDDSHSVHLTKRLWSVPENIDVYMPEVPFLTKVPAGKIFEEQLQLPLPLMINFPYQFTADVGKNMSRHPVQLMAQELVFSIGYVILENSEAINQLKPMDGQSYFSLPYGVGMVNQRIEKGERITIDLGVSDFQ